MNPNLTVMADVLEMNAENVAAVVITGLVVVFAGLVILIAFVACLGAIFEGIKKSKAKKQAAKNNVVSQEKPKVSAPVPAPTPVVEDGISDEIVAVIAAAVSAMGASAGKKLALRSVKTAKPSRNAWAAAGLQDNTRPFF